MANNTDLDHLLDQWQDVPASNPQLKHHVWTRIALSDRRSGMPIQSLFGGLISALSRPLPATLFVGASIACGILIAEMRVNTAKQARTEVVARHYIQLVNSQQPLASEEAFK